MKINVIGGGTWGTTLACLLSKTSKVALTETVTAFIKVIVFDALLSSTSIVTSISLDACVFVICIPIRTHFELLLLGHVNTVVGLPELLLIFSAKITKDI